jgi:hypothetical protein
MQVEILFLGSLAREDSHFKVMASVGLACGSGRHLHFQLSFLSPIPTLVITLESPSLDRGWAPKGQS